MLLRLFYTILFLTVSVCAQAQYSKNYIHITTKDGLPTNKVYGVHFDKRGFAWVYTQNGVARYDGYNFKHFGPERGMATNDVWDMVEDTIGRIWCFAFNRYPTYIKNDTAHMVYNPEATVNDYNYVYQSNGETFLRARSAKPVAPFFMRLKEQDSLEAVPMTNWNAFSKKYFGKYKASSIVFPNIYWHVINKEIVYTDSNLNVISRITDVNYKEVRASLVVPFTEKKWYIDFFSNGLLLLKGPNTNKSIKLKKEYLERNTKMLKLARIDNNINITDGYGNILKVDTNLNIIDYFKYDATDPLFSGRSSGFIDPKGNVWISTMNKGVLFLPKSKRIVSTLKLKDGSNYKAPNIIRKIDNKLYIGCINGSVFFYDKGNLKCIASENFTDKNDIKEIFKLDKQLWFVGRFVFKQGANGFINLTKKRIQGRIIQTAKSVTRRDDNAFFFSRTGFLYQITSDLKVKKLPTDVRYYSMAYEKEKGLWLGGIGGLQYWDEARDTVYNVLRDSLKTDIAKLVLSGKTLWIGTSGQRLWKYNTTNKKLQQVDRSKIAPYNIIDIYVDSVKNITWVATSSGVYGYDYKKDSVLHHFNDINTLSSNEVNCVYPLGDTLIVGTADGLSFIPLKEYQETQSNSSVRILSYQVNYKYQDPNDKLVLNYRENSIRITFSALDYGSIGNTVYKFRLKENRNWQSIRTNELELNDLKPGQYHFEIYAEGAPDKIASIKFDIKPPYWKTWWFILLCIILILAVAYYLYRRRIKQIELKAEQEKEVTKKIADLEMSALQSQMNPHFIFNALGSIQYYQRENVELADEYLGKFARLMRLFLESSKKKYTTLNEELSLLKLYMAMEKIRLQDKLTYEFIVDEKLDPEIDELPTMIVQPFVENSINHGIFHKEGPGHLSIEFVQFDKETIQVIITDDGIGRAKAAEIKKKSLKTHTSRAMQIVEDKLSILDTGARFEIEDLSNNIGQNAGTRVTLWLPY